jgi:hypothetical protein
MAGEEDLGSGDVLRTDVEEVSETLDERSSAAMAEVVAEVGACGRTGKAEEDDQQQGVMAGGSPSAGGEQQSLAWKRNTRAFDEDAKPRRGVTERVHN